MGFNLRLPSFRSPIRISQILKRKTRKRIEEARKAELENASSSASNTQSRSNNHQNYRDDSMSDYSSSVGGNGSAYGGAGGHPRLAAPPLGMKIAPTLPDVNIDEAEMMGVGGGSGVVMYHQPQQMQQYTRHQQPRYARSDYGGSDYGGSDGTGGTMQSRNGGNPGAFYITSNQNHGIPPIPALPPIHGSSPSGVDNRYYQQQHYYAQYYPSLVHQQYHQQQYSQSATTVQSSSFNENNNSNRVGGGGVVMGRESFPDSQQDLISRDDEGSGTPPPELLYPGMQGHPMTK